MQKEKEKKISYNTIRQNQRLGSFVEEKKEEIKKEE